MKELLHTPIFDVVELNEIEPGFRPVAIEAPDWVSVIVEKNQKFLMVQQLRFGTMEITTEFPSGTVEKNEKPITAACRELREETGLIVDENDLINLGSVSPNPAFMRNKKYTFYVNLDEVNYTETEQKLDSHEHVSYKWVRIADVLTDFGEGSGTDPAMLGTSLFLWLFNRERVNI